MDTDAHRSEQGPAAKPAISALIVTYNSAGHVRACAEAAARYCDEVLVVDNASTDATREELAEIAKVRLIANPDNRGFAGGVNQGMAAAEHDLVLLLNPDAVLLDDPAPLAAEVASGRAAVAAGLLMDDNGQPQTGFALRRFPTPAALSFEALGINRLWPRNPVNRRWRCLDCDLTQPQPAEQPAGAFLMIDRAAWRQVGGFDERFFPVWFEDVDFLKKIHGNNGGVFFLPSVRARHSGAHSVGQLTGSLQRKYWYGSLFKYAGKHFSPAGRKVTAAAVLVGAVARWLVFFVKPQARAGQGYGPVIRLALANLVGWKRSDP